MSSPERITSRENPLVALLRRLQADPAAYRKLGLLWLEGEHLVSAYRSRVGQARAAVFAEAAWARPALRALGAGAQRVVLLPDALFRGVSGLESPASVGLLVERPAEPAIVPAAPTVVLDRLQDAGNVGSILRSAAAFGFAQVLALKGSAALWSPKVLRAGMGAHFALALHEGLAPGALDALGVPLLATSSHAAAVLGSTPLPWPCAWVLGHEGQGIAPELQARCSATLRIAQPGGEESLNVAAAAAVCLYESSRGAPAGAAQ